MSPSLLADLPPTLPVIDLDLFRGEPGSEAAAEECKKVSLHTPAAFLETDQHWAPA